LEFGICFFEFQTQKVSNNYPQKRLNQLTINETVSNKGEQKKTPPFRMALYEISK